MNKNHLSGWQQIFLIEGGLTIFLAFITFKFLTDYPATSSCMYLCIILYAEKYRLLILCIFKGLINVIGIY